MIFPLRARAFYMIRSLFSIPRAWVGGTMVTPTFMPVPTFNACRRSVKRDRNFWLIDPCTHTTDAQADLTGFPVFEADGHVRRFFQVSAAKWQEREPARAVSSSVSNNSPASLLI